MGNCGNQIPALAVSVKEDDVSERRKVIRNSGYYQLISVTPVVLSAVNAASVERKLRTECEVVTAVTYF
jgi:hypothetical protein